jgi:hypothetical protein
MTEAPTKAQLWYRAWYRKNRNRVCEKRRARYAADPELERAKSRAQYARRRQEVSQYNKKYRTENRDRIRAQKRKYAYGLNDPEYRALLKNQRGRCAICRKPPGVRGLHVDHDHATRKVRGLLCSKCNTGIGLLQHSPALLTKAVAYLKAA